MLCYVYSSGTITAEHFMHFLNTRVRPMLLEDSYGIFDNARIHTTMNSRIVMEQVFDEQYYFCPPYSPHLKPIVEPCFALVKQWIRENEINALQDPVEYINRAFHIHRNQIWLKNWTLDSLFFKSSIVSLYASQLKTI
jgi:hypothetical protein